MLITSNVSLSTAATKVRSLLMPSPAC